MYHIPVMLQPCVDALVQNENGVYVDVTFGGGGHSKEILNRLGTSGHLYGFDQDDDARRNIPANDKFTFVQSNFKYLQKYLRYFKALPVDGILADLGVSSFQIDEPERGFSFRFEGKLDMRMNQFVEQTAANILNTYSEENLVRILSSYGEVRNAKTLARQFVASRKNAAFETNADLIGVLEKLYIGNRNKYIAQVYQALRMEVNEETAALEAFLTQAKEVLKPGGRLVVMSYHSIEDRLVKRLMKTGNIAGELVRDERGAIQRPFKLITKKPVVPTNEEINENSRARSAKLRIAEKL